MVHHEKEIRIIEGVRSKDNIQWLERSLIVETKCPIQTEEMAGILQIWSIDIQSIRDLGCFMFIISFDSHARLQSSFNFLKENMVSKCFNIRKWSEDEVCTKRSVWLEVFGIPPHAWCIENMRLATDNIGTLDWFETKDKGSIASTMVLVNRNQLFFIDDQLSLRIGDKIFEVFVRELDHNIKHIPCFFCVPQGNMDQAFLKEQKSSMEALEGGEVKERGVKESRAEEREDDLGFNVVNVEHNDSCNPCSMSLHSQGSSSLGIHDPPDNGQVHVSDVNAFGCSSINGASTLLHNSPTFFIDVVNHLPSRDFGPSIFSKNGLNQGMLLVNEADSIDVAHHFLVVKRSKYS